MGKIQPTRAGIVRHLVSLPKQNSLGMHTIIPIIIYLKDINEPEKDDYCI